MSASSRVVNLFSLVDSSSASRLASSRVETHRTRYTNPTASRIVHRSTPSATSAYPTSTTSHVSSVRARRDDPPSRHRDASPRARPRASPPARARTDVPHPPHVFTAPPPRVSSFFFFISRDVRVDLCHRRRREPSSIVGVSDRATIRLHPFFRSIAIDRVDARALHRVERTVDHAGRTSIDASRDRGDRRGRVRRVRGRVRGGKGGWIGLPRGAIEGRSSRDASIERRDGTETRKRARREMIDDDARAMNDAT